MAIIMGGQDAADALASYLRRNFPAVLTVVREQNELTGEDLPEPKLITSAEIPEVPIESWPALVATVERIVEQRATDIDSRGRTVYDVTYRMAIEGYVRGSGFEATGAMNRRYAACVRALLNAHPTLTLGRWAESYPRVDTSTVLEEYAPTFEATRGRTLASFRTTFDLHQHEPTADLSGVVTGEFATAHVTTQIVGPDRPMPKHPAL